MDIGFKMDLLQISFAILRKNVYQETYKTLCFEDTFEEQSIANFLNRYERLRSSL